MTTNATNQSRHLTRTGMAGSTAAAYLRANQGFVKMGRPEPPSDPILAAITEHREANADHAAKCRANDGSKKNIHLDEVAGLRALGALFHLFTTPPTTLAGIAAVLHYVASPAYNGPGQFIGGSILANGLDYSAGVGRAAREFTAHIAAALCDLSGETRAQLYAQTILFKKLNANQLPNGPVAPKKPIKQRKTSAARKRRKAA